MSPGRKKAANAAIAVGVLVTLVGGSAAFAQHQAAQSAHAQAAATYQPSTTYTVPAAPTKVAFLGDSYTYGTGTTESRYNRWSTQLSNEQGWLELNYGKGGTNYGSEAQSTGSKAYADRLTDLIVSNPDIVVVSSAGNRVEDDQRPGIRATFTELREKLPEAKLVALSPFYWDDEYPSRYEKFGQQIREEVEAVDGLYVDIGHPLGDRPEAIAEDGTHPNDKGYELLTAAIRDALREAGVTGGQTES